MSKSRSTGLPEAPTTPGSSAGRIWPLLTLPAFLVGLLFLVGAGIFSGSAAPGSLGDPGAFVRWALPVAKVLHHGSMSITIAALVFAAVILPRSTNPKRLAQGRDDTDGGQPHPAFARSMNLAATCGMVWTISAAAVLVLTFWALVGKPMSLDPSYTSAMLDFMLEINVGRAWAWMIAIAGITSSLALGVRSTGWVGATSAFSLVGLVPVSMIGHAAGGDDHWGAVNAIGLHLLGVALWFGGIAVLAALAPLLQAMAPGRYNGSRPILAGTVLRRFSSLATVAIVLVTGSGIVSATIRVTGWEQWMSPYGLLVIAKALATILLGVLGLAHRRYVIPRLEAGKLGALQAAWQVVGAETILMAAAMSLGTVLGSTAPPTSDAAPEIPTPARLLTGYELPPEVGVFGWVTVWRFDWLWMAIAIFLAVAYISAVASLRRRGERWPSLHLASWLVGLTVIFYVTSGAPAVYGKVLFSTHMTYHVALIGVAPLFLALGLPLTLALKALPARPDGTRGPREWMLVLVHSRLWSLVTHPLFAAAFFTGSILVFYNTEVLNLDLKQHVIHELINGYFLVTGYVFAQSLIGADPGSWRAPARLRMLVLLAIVIFHAIYGYFLMGSTSLIQADWFGNMGRPWGGPALEDQHLGAAAMWGLGAVPVLFLGARVVRNRDKTKEPPHTDHQPAHDKAAGPQVSP